MTRHPRTPWRPVALAVALLCGPAAASADSPPPVMAVAPPSVDPAPSGPTDRPRVGPRVGTSAVGGRASGGPESSGNWWFGTAGVALALAACGWASLASRRFLGKGADGSAVAGLKVVGKTALSPRHSVYLLRAGDRVLIIGTGPQGAPSLLGEMPGTPDRPRADRREPAAPVPADDGPTAPPDAGQGAVRRFDYRLGDDT